MTLGQSNYHMVNVEEKAPTRRLALATGELIATRETIEKIKQGSLPKGNPLPMAEVAGIMAAKKTSEILPLCHPLNLDSVSVSFKFSESAVKVWAEVITTSKTGVEMEALAAVQAALLCIYDLTKPVDPALEISNIYLEKKEGGKKGVWHHPLKSNAARFIEEQDKLDLNGISFSIITLSDRASLGEYQDLSGEFLRNAIIAARGSVIKTDLLPDNPLQLMECLTKKLNSKIHFCLLTGGTGLSQKDITPDVLNDFCIKNKGRIIPGIGELLRKNGAQFTPFSWLSRSEAYEIQTKVFITLPGSLKGVQQGWSVLLPLLNHLVRVHSGEDPHVTAQK